MISIRKFTAVLGIVGAATLPQLTAAPMTIGSGPDSSFLVIEGSTFSVSSLVYQVNYSYDPMVTFDTFDLMQIVGAEDPLLSFEFQNFGSEIEPNYILNSVTYNSVTLTNTPFPATGPYWSQSVSGGEAGFPTAAPIPSGSWTYGSGASDPFRVIQPGSWDGFVFSEGDAPSIAPIPEPGTLVLLAVGIGFLVLIRRRVA